MRGSQRFAIGVHILSLLGTESDTEPTSEWMAGSIGVNAVIVRNITGMLRRAGLVHTRQGAAGAQLAKQLESITLLDVYRAVEEAEPFAIHANPNPNCPVGANIQTALEKSFGDAKRAMELQLAATTMQDVLQNIHPK
jgi:DNA-binding IscR family transcriptional regulator